MAYQRGIYGIEYNPPRREPEAPWVTYTLLLVAVTAVAVFGVRSLMRLTSSDRGESDELVIPPVELPVPPPVVKSPSPSVEAPAPPSPGTGAIKVTGVDSRPSNVRMLLLRLEEADRKRDSELAIATIERLRSLPGNPAADLDDSLARRLGALNLQRLFGERSGRWVTEVEVRSGDSASRIAHAHGSTLASLVRLNPGLDPDRIRSGSRLFVLDHPRFILVVHRMTKTADLSLKGKFFKRYYLTDAVKAEAGNYPLSDRPRIFWAEKGLAFAAADRAELEMLLVPGTSVVVSDL